MTRGQELDRWAIRLGARTDNEAVAKLRRLLSRLEDGERAVQTVYRHLSSYGHETYADDMLSDARGAIAEANNELVRISRGFAEHKRGER